MKLTPPSIRQFQSRVWTHYAANQRSMPWRDNHSLYYVVVSEIMLQQTQVDRVVPKFEAFVARFPDFISLSNAPLAEVLTQWQGLGYNRRAKFLHDAARQIVSEGEPRTLAALQRLPGVGHNTAAAVMAYVYNEPTVYVETNIRTVFLTEFFADADGVEDKTIIDLVAQTLDHSDPRQWYWALMDYGTYLKKSNAHLSKSKSYRKQSPLKGSVREMRGVIIKLLAIHDRMTSELAEELSDERFDRAKNGLIRDGLVKESDGRLHLTGSNIAS